MDDNFENRPIETTPAPETSINKNPDVGFPLSQRKPKTKSGIWIFIIVLIIILAGGLIFFLSKGKSNTPESSPTPPEENTNIEVVTSTPSPSSLPTPSVADKTKVKIEIQNGTGITGEAAYLQGILKGIDYSNIKVGNSTTQDNTNTMVSFSDTLDKGVVQEITSLLDLTYQQVDTQTSSTITTDVLIVTGLRKGATAKPVASETPTLTP